MKKPTRVLIVDDREVVRHTLRTILLGFDCVFFEAENGARALELIPVNEFDVIILDLKLPDHSGIEILREARKLCAILGKVIILTGHPAPGTQAEANDLGVFRYLTKNPIDRTQIRTAFAEAISAPTPLSRPEKSSDHVIGRTPVPRTRRAVGANSHRASRPRVLVLDGDQFWLDQIERVLGDDFYITLATRADEARKRVRKEHFGLVVLDMKLEDGVSGLDVLSQMRRDVPDLRAIILAEHPDFGAAFESGRRGAIDYVSKGELEILSHTVRRALTDRATPIRVFLSYERTDRAKVVSLYNKLMAQGFLPWMDKMSIGAGKDWEFEIRKAIDETDFFVYCLSHHSLYKEGMMRKEIKQALERQEGMLAGRVFFITARLENCEALQPFKNFQYVDLFRKEGFGKLIRAFSPTEKLSGE